MPPRRLHRLSLQTNFNGIPRRPVLCSLLLLLFASVEGQGTRPWTPVHESNTCALYDTCGKTELGNLPCPNNRPAAEVDDALAAALADYCPYLWKDISNRRRACCTLDVLKRTHEQMQRALPFFEPCPACANNFANLWCTIACSPDQSTFANVMEVQPGDVSGSRAVKEVNYYLSDAFKSTLFHSCKEVKFSSTTDRFLIFFGDPQTPDDFLGFLGRSGEEGGMAPYSLNFPSASTTPEDMTPVHQALPDCGSPGFECSCADCSTASYCTPVKEKEDKKESKCRGPLRCYEYAIVTGGVLVLFFLVWLIFRSSFDASMHHLSVNDNSSDNSYEPMSDGNEFTATLLEDESIRYGIVETWLRMQFRRLGEIVARRPYLMIVLSLLLVLVLSLGNIYYDLESNPQNLWTPKGSRTEENKKRYEETFGEFYRIENIIVATTDETKSPGRSPEGRPTIFTYRNMDLMFRIHDVLHSITATVQDGDEDYSVGIEDVCYKPMGVCIFESVLQYWQLNRTNWESALEETKEEAKTEDEQTIVAAKRCLDNWTTKCRSAFRSPVDPKIVLGGFPTDDTFRSFIEDTTAFSMTVLVDSSQENRQSALAWEKAFIQTVNGIVKDMTIAEDLEIAFNTERSTEDEIKRETYMDAWTVAISYLVMFLYIATSLTFLTKRHPGLSESILIRSHVTLALSGVVIVVMSVMAAFGVISYLKMEVSMIVLEVLPFLVLAVGVDNMFILANEIRTEDPALPLSLRMGTALIEVGPSIACAAISEALAFGLAAAAPIPAVRTFSLCACFAIVLDFILQCFLFTSILVLDARRRESGRIDCFPCIKLGGTALPEEPVYVVSDTGTPTQETPQQPTENYLQMAISGFLVPFLLRQDRRIVRWSILSISAILFTVSCIFLGRMELGMEQQVAFPADSYLQDYFRRGLPMMRVGAPVMFVAEDVDVSEDSKAVDKICGIAGCRPDSLVSRIDLAAAAGAHHLATPASSWIDEFVMWFETGSCCRLDNTTGDYCTEQASHCLPCSVDLDQKNIFKRHLPGFMKAVPSEQCPRGGRGIFEDYIQHRPGDASEIVGLDEDIVKASAFRTNYVQLTTQNDYIEALKETYDFVDDLKKELGMEIYAYSVFHVFFQQYLDIVQVASWMIATAVGAVFAACVLLLGSFRAAAIVMICVVMVLVDLVGVGYLSGIKLNGVSVVNLTMSIGIAVEFCVHLAHAFCVVPGTRAGRVGAAYRGVGVSIVTGITLTKFVGVVVLAFARTELFRVYYFRMYMALVVLGAWHGLVVLPILLALFGPSMPVRSSIRIKKEEED